MAFGITRSEKHAFAVLELGGVLDSGLAETGELPTLTEFWAEKSMKLPAYERAVVPERKIVAYLLSLSHRDGRSKAVFFMRFGFTPDRWQTLADALIRHAAEHDIATADNNAFGTNYVIEGRLQTPDGRMPHIRVVWFIAIGETIPYLATAYPLKGAGDD